MTTYAPEGKKIHDIRENLFNWYDFKSNSDILFIGSDIYESVSKNNNVTVLTNETTFKNDNVKTIHGKLDNFFNNEVKYDYIIISSALEKMECYIDDKKDLIDNFLNIAYGMLKEDGVLLLVVQNKFSIKNFSGATYKNGMAYDVILGKEKNPSISSKNEMVSTIKRSDFKYFKFYYPFPDHKLPSIIYSDEYLPRANNSKLNYLIYYNPKDTIIFNEMEAMHEIAKDGMLDYFANSYLIELSNSKEAMSKVKFASYNNFRKDDIKLITKMYDGYVQKTPIKDEAIKHIESMKENLETLKKCNLQTVDTVDDQKVVSKYQSLKTLNEYIGELVEKKEIDKVEDIIDKWYRKIYDSSLCMFCEMNANDSNVFKKYDIMVADNVLKKMHFLTDCLFDLIFENIFIDINEKNEFNQFIIYDQEWKEKNAPVEFILYRAINHLYEQNSKIGKYLSKERLYSKFYITEFVLYFEALDEKIQKSMIDEEIVNYYKQTYCALTNLEGIKSSFESKIEDEKQKYTRLLNDVNRTNNEWQSAVDQLQSTIEKYRKKDIIYQIKKKIKGK